MPKGTLGTCLIVALCLFQGCDAVLIDWSEPGAINTSSGTITIATANGAHENITAGTALFNATATANGTVSYELVDDASGKGTIVPATGVVSLATGQSLDYETAMTLVFIVKGTDATDSSAGTATITLPIIDLNEAPVYTKAQQDNVCVADKSIADTLVGTYTAKDQDADDSIAYSINSGNNSTGFAYGTDGSLKVATNKTLDQRTTATYTLVLHAIDDGTPALTGSTTVTVNVKSTCNAAGAFGTLFISVLLTVIVSFLL
ncbi:cadherin EGF LAG seven-pass G-type receptor fmi-1-like [Mya arenaria]|uniref:cadherin EGF LAG seven-pass G-type receptor fmi-1-like n=1 Tax=Mya arenaria TaxID=6604 RepID=UPI0022E4372D|nr:cadherin EGF LAG seven-pass G-type receptor fmi-1-like [Mya arenaria]